MHYGVEWSVNGRHQVAIRQNADHQAYGFDECTGGNGVFVIIARI